jgi:hypothetical protein
LKQQFLEIAFQAAISEPMKFLTALIVASFPAPFALGADADGAVTQKLKQSYHTEPHDLKGNTAFEKYNAEIMALWADAEARKSDYISALKSLLSGKDMIPYFYFDGAMLLLSLEDSADNRKLAASAIPKTDPRDVPGENYVNELINLGNHSTDTSRAVVRILDVDDFRAIYPQHALTLGQEWSFITAAMPLEPALVEAAIRERMKKPLGDNARASITLWAWQAATPETDKLFAEIWPGLPKGKQRTAAADLAAKMHPKTLSKPDLAKLAKLRKKRSDRIRIVSDEALIDNQQTTAKMRAILGDH